MKRSRGCEIFLFQADYELLKNVDDDNDVVTGGNVVDEQNEVKKTEVGPNKL